MCVRAALFWASYVRSPFSTIFGGKNGHKEQEIAIFEIFKFIRNGSYTNSSVNKDSFYANLTNFQNIPIPHLTRNMYILDFNKSCFLHHLAGTYLQPHHGNVVFGNVYLSAGQD